MNAIKSIFRWLFRQGFVFVLIVAALAFHQFAWPMIADGAAQSAVASEWKSPAEIRAELRALKQQTIEDLEASQNELLTKSGSALTAALEDRRKELAVVDEQLDQRQGVFASVRPTAIIAREQLKLRKARLSAEIDLLNSVKNREAAQLKLSTITYPSETAVSRTARACNSANAAVKAFNDLTPAERRARDLVFGTAEKLTQSASNECGRYKARASQRTAGLAAGRAAREKLAKSNDALLLVQEDITSRLRRYSPDVTNQTIQALLLKALLILAGIIALPFIIRALFYYVLAPIAERRASIRLSVPGGGTVPIPPAELARVSIPITLARGEELLVRQDYLQTSSLSGRKDTRWLLDYGHVLSSIASGLTFLTRIRGEGETTTISAVRDAFAELTQLTLPVGTACVLHPRALVAVVQPEGQPLRITSHWRLLSLNAWLTLQLRYLVFHGPGSLIVKGGRGIRVERAERGRIFGQDQLVGFSADLDYSVTRTETFAPYFFGHEQLFKDKVEQGCGILIIEEAPLSSQQGGGVRRGLEGSLDAGMKAFGL